MTRRHAQLVPLTHDHHHALKHARRLGLAAQSSNPAALTDATTQFLEAYEAELLPHFREEEEQLLPLLPADREAKELTARTLLEHVELHRLARSLKQHLRTGPPPPETVRALSELLRAHVRMEEDELFPLVERIVSEADLAGLRLAPRYRTAPGGPDSSGAPPRSSEMMDPRRAP